ncbi:uroporphyrinogen decarboxylase family protein [Oceanispirochaeta sp. M1]|uniref:uroporphyrinogen decarboxylase family protein n=2 Tax=Oceanispirochaeta TaxID=2035349 RepID=UPI0018AC461B|nr:uroporphyrinogen decarboxylase family protein [Oceanispirochaeta sp. M1]
MKLALNHKEADRVPYDLAGTTVTSISGIAWERAMKHRGLSPEFDDSKTVDIVSQIIIPPEEKLVELKVDTRRIGAGRVLDQDKSLKKEGDTWSFIDQYNCRWEMVERKDYYFNQTSHPLEQYEDIQDVLKNLTIPDLSCRKAEYYELFDKQRAELGEAALVADRNCAGLTEMFLRFRGYENGYMDMALYPDESRELMDLIAEHKMQYWDIFGDYIVDRGLQDSFLVAAECDDLGTQQSLLVSEGMLEDIVFPSMTKYISFIKNKIPGIKVFFHSCGAVKPLIPKFIETGIDILNPVQYTASTMDLKGLKRDFGEDICFWGGGVDTQEVLSKGSPERVRDEVKKNLDIMAPGGGFVFVPVHNIQEDVPPENFWAMWDAWNDFSAY